MGQDKPLAHCDKTISDQDFLPELLGIEQVDDRPSSALDESAQAFSESIECVSVLLGAVNTLDSL